uniref:Uncharacterized protein n=1 Tax=Meloidogyne incognita TaxID=6306 RepID=A0A914LX73_MELIC
MMMARMLHKFCTKCKFCSTFNDRTTIKMPTTAQNTHAPTQMSTTPAILFRINPFHTSTRTFICEPYLMEFLM